MHPKVANRCYPGNSALSAVERGVFVSDLHLFSSWSSGEAILPQLKTQQLPTECIVLGGDIFDFRWSTHGGLASSLQHASHWLRTLLDATGDCQIVYLLGNHDSHPLFQETLQALSSNPRFSWASHTLQLGNNLFLHGDILDARSDVRLPAYRSQFHHTHAQSALAHGSYRWAVAARFHKIIPFGLHRPSRTCQRLVTVLRTSSAGLDDSRREPIDLETTSHIFFGHTHVPLNGFRAEGFHFYNPGATLRHMKHYMAEFKCLRDDSIPYTVRLC